MSQNTMSGAGRNKQISWLQASSKGNIIDVYSYYA
jgi:hypothetical protein